jgi:hypothetical protein
MRRSTILSLPLKLVFPGLPKISPNFHFLKLTFHNHSGPRINLGVRCNPFGSLLKGIKGRYLVIGDDFDLAMKENSDAGVGRSQVDPNGDSFRHLDLWGQSNKYLYYNYF